jgi:ethanolamine ammonia-lyase small subunit
MAATKGPGGEIAPGGGRDPWRALAAHTPARIALGRAGGSLRTESLLELRLAHAGARDAVHSPFDAAALEGVLQGHGLATERLATAASDRGTYLARPDLGRILSSESEARLRSQAAAWGGRDLAILVSDGLSAEAAASHAAAAISELANILTASGWSHYPIFVVPYARVKLQDAVGALLGARHSVILLGERPGLSAHDSLGAYLTLDPRAERTDADRNCVSNIRAGGLPPLSAARKIAGLLVESRRLGISGTALRDTDGRGAAGLPAGTPRMA